MKLNLLVKSVVDLNLNDSGIVIPKGTKGILVSVDEIPKGANPENWFGWNVRFPDFTGNENFPCKFSEFMSDNIR